MTASILELEQKDIELQLMEIQLKRRMIKIERENLKNNINPDVSDHPVELPEGPVNCRCSIPLIERVTYLHYNESSKKNVPKVKNVCPDGSVYIRGKNDSMLLSHKITMRSLLWIKQMLPVYAKQQNMVGFWEHIAEVYSRKFAKTNRTSVQSYFYFVDSGLCDEWFEQYSVMKDGVQSRLEI